MTYFGYVKNDFKFKHIVNYVIVGAALILFTVLQLVGAIPRSTSYLLTQISYSIILSVSLNLVVGFLGELSLGHAGFMCAGAYIGCYFGGILSEYIGSKLLVLIISMLIGGIVAAVFGLIVGLPALRLKGDYLAIVTLAFGEIVRNLCKNVPWFGKSLGLSTKTYGVKLFIVGFAVILIMLILLQNLIRSKHGRAITAIRDNEIAARAMGINVTYYKLFVFVFSAFFAGVAGVLYGNYATPVLYSFFSYNYSIEILVMVVLGGMGNITGSIISATLITIANFILTTKLSGDLAAIKNLVYALILMVVVIFNNAPALQSFKEKFSFAALNDRLMEKKRAKNPEKFAADIRNDSAQWSRIPTKISMDEILSTDVVSNEGIRDEGDKPSAK
ncbi:MAG: branched-chain amino acid ABC transporter permease [Firmicutes bacterium]|nr:branched-chain amino acid ABC transporter permease [Candidatus Colimorpha enterica]